MLAQKYPNAIKRMVTKIIIKGDYCHLLQSPSWTTFEEKKMNMKKQIGIWLDNKEAYIITVNPNESTVEKIESEVEDFHLKGGSPAKTPYGAVDATSETKLLARKKQQFRKYYQNIMDKVKDADELFIMGPAEAKIGLRTKMTETKSFQPFIKGFESADSVSDNQKIERTREFFGQKTRV